MLSTAAHNIAHTAQQAVNVASQAIGGDNNPNAPHPKEGYPSPPFLLQSEQNSPGLEKAMNPKPDFGELSYRGTGKLTGKIALITGGDSGIGRAVALAYAREGANVALSYLPEEEEDAKEIQTWIEKENKNCLLLPNDISLEEQCKKIVDDTVREFGRIDILVNNAAFQGKTVEKFEDITRERVEHTFKVNIIAMFSITKYALPHMKEGSCIINTASIEAYQPDSFIIDYACTKAAIMNFTKGLAQELITRGIRVNAVAPGPVWTPLVVASFKKSQIADFGKKHSPLGRPAQPAELAPAYVFLADQSSRYVNSEILSVTGGTPTM